MRVIFEKNVPRVAQKYDVKDVSDGYARNFLIPKNIARLATPEELKRLSARREREEKTRIADEEKRVSSLSALAGTAVELSRRANDEGHLFAAINVGDIAEELKRGHGIEIEPRLLKIEKPIKALGTYTVRAGAPERGASFTVRVFQPEEKGEKIYLPGR